MKTHHLYIYSKNILLSSLFLLLTGILQYGAAQNIPPRPNPPRLVNDLANILSPTEENALERKLVRYNDTTSTQILVLTVPDFGGDAPYNYAQEVGEQWGVGQRGVDNGVVMLIDPIGGPGEKQVFIGTGYGVESKLTDAQSKAIIDRIMIPAFRQQQFYYGIDEATTRIMHILQGTYVGDIGGNANSDFTFWLFIALIILFFFVLPMLMRNRHDDDDNHRHGRRRGRTYTDRGGTWGPIIFTGGGGGSDWGDFRSGGGGFGGFGGGSFGGGGAGGSW